MQIALVILVFALPGLLLRRSGPWLARMAALGALLAIGVAVLDLPEEIRRSKPTAVTVVPTGTGPLPETLTRPGLRVEAGPDRMRVRAERARLRHRDEPQTVLIWNGPVATAQMPREAGAKGAATVLTTANAAVLDPEEIELRSGNVARAQRPATLELSLGAGPGVEFRGRVRVVDPDGSTVFEKGFANPGRGGRPIRFAWEPKQAGAHEVHLSLTAGGVEFRASGVVAVGPAPELLVVGARGRNLAKALRAQGLAVRTTEAVPAQPAGTLVLTGPIDAATQARVLRFVEEGGGLFLVGGADGGAVPAEGEVLAAISPVRRPSLEPKRPEEGGIGSGPGTKDPERPDPAGAVDPPKTRPDPKEGPQAATGNTSGAQVKIEEREVKRRRIAMVLLVDRSTSMTQHEGNKTRMDYARASALQTAEALDSDDWLGVVSFGSRSQAKVVLPMTSVTKKGRIRKALESLRATDNETFVADGLDQARTLLEGVDAAIKFVVTISDGDFHVEGEDEALLAASRYKKSRVTMSIVQVLATSVRARHQATGRAHKLAQFAGGTLFSQTSFDVLPRVVIVEVERLRVQAGRRKRKGDAGPDGSNPKGPKPPEKPPEKPPKKNEKPDPEDRKPAEREAPPPRDPAPREWAVHQIEDSRLLAPETAPFPPVGGVLEARARPHARTLLAAGPQGFALLAFANRGLGKVGAFTADLTEDWGAKWLADGAFPGRLAQWIQFLEPADGAPREARVVHRPAPHPVVPTPREIGLLETLGGSAVRPAASFEAPGPRIQTEIRGRAARHAWYGVLALVFLVGIEFLLSRRFGRRGART